MARPRHRRAGRALGKEFLPNHSELARAHCGCWCEEKTVNNTLMVEAQNWGCRVAKVRGRFRDERKADSMVSSRALPESTTSRDLH